MTGRLEGERLSFSPEYFLMYVTSLGFFSMIGVLFVDFCDRKLPKMLGIK